MITAADLIPASPTLKQIREIAAGCQACDLWRKGTQTVFGKGRSKAQVMFVGEQPGNDEDLAGEPFVGPAGKLLDKALEEAGIDRGIACYKRRQALQMGTERQAAHSCKAELTGDHPMLTLAANGDPACEARAGRLSRRHRFPGAIGTRVSSNATKRRAA